MTDNTPPSSFFSMVKGEAEHVLSPNDKPMLNNDSNEADSLNWYSQENSIADNTSSSLTSSDSLLKTEVVNTDESDMPHDARRVLVHLLRQGSVMASQKPKVFEQLIRFEIEVRKHLSEVYLRLVLDQKTGVAFVASTTSEHIEETSEDELYEEEFDSEESATLIPKRTLSLFDTLILLVLRKHYQERESSGEQKITIDIERLESYLAPFLPITDHASKDRKKLLARVKEMIKRKVLSTIRGVEDRYEITPIIRYVVSANFLEEMLTEYMSLASDKQENNQKEWSGLK
ncbi:DUF4194 domain-containing protein [Rheinheimera gaetbuli]